jgi:hypothetical protein
MMMRFAFFFALLFELGLVTTVHAQGSAVAQLYGEGVHRYFAGDYMGAEQSLSRAVEAGSQDPRVFYFRGLSRAAYGGGGGEVDYEQGARLEASGRVGANIGMSLARIQGHERAKIEKARHEARLVAQQQREQARLAMPPTPPPTPNPPTPPAATDPFSGDGLRSEQVEVQPDPVVPLEETSQPDAVVDPFAEEPTAPDADSAPEVVDPFSDADAAPAEVAPADSDDPFAE